MSELDLSTVQIETLFKLEYLKTLNDIDISPVTEKKQKKEPKEGMAG